MADTENEYSLSELIKELGVSPAWVNKVQKQTGAVGKIGARGKKVTYTEEEASIFRNVKTLRMLDFALSDIRKIYKIEQRMMSLAKAFPLTMGTDNPKYIIHPYGFTAEPPLGIHGLPLSGDQYNEFAGLTNTLISIAKEVARRASKLKNECEGIMSAISNTVCHPSL